MKRIHFAMTLLVTALPAMVAEAGDEPQTVTLIPVRDTTIYSESNAANALGQHLFAGRVATSSAVRRALIRFDLTDIPPGSAVSEASLNLTLDKTVVGPRNILVHRLLESWGTGSSLANGAEGAGGLPTDGDATWNSRFHGTGPAWTTPGGTFTPVPSAEVEVGFIGFENFYSWNTSGMAADVQRWIDNPATNFGWILVGDDTTTSAKRFGSSENSSAETIPMLTVTFTGGTPLTHRQEWEHQYFPGGGTIDPKDDPDHDGLSNLIEYALDLSPVSPSVLAPLAAVRETDGIMVRFLRDPRAIDLTYRLESSPNHASWETIAESVAGAAAAGSFVQGEAPVPQSPLREVTCALPSLSTRGFFRVTVISR